MKNESLTNSTVCHSKNLKPKTMNFKQNHENIVPISLNMAKVPFDLIHVISS